MREGIAGAVEGFPECKAVKEVALRSCLSSQLVEGAAETARAVCRFSVKWGGMRRTLKWDSV
jgi:hypothetical protein